VGKAFKASAFELPMTKAEGKEIMKRIIAQSDLQKFRMNESASRGVGRGTPFTTSVGPVSIQETSLQMPAL